MTSTFRFVRSLIIGAGIGSLAATGYAQEIKIGYNGDLSASPTGVNGFAAAKGIETAIEDLNASGGVLGRKFVFLPRDDFAQPPKAIQNMSELIDSEKVTAVFGPSNSGNAFAWKHIPNAKKVPVISTVGSATDITKPMQPGADNYMFRVTAQDRDQSAELIAYIKHSTATKNVGYLVENTGYGMNALKDLQELGALNGIKEVAVEKFGTNDTDMTSQLNKLKAANVDIVVIWAQGTPIAQVLRSMEKINYFPVSLTCLGADMSSFQDVAGKMAEKAIFVRTTPAARDEKQQQMFKRLMPKLKSEGSFHFGAYSYDAMMILAQAIKQAGTTDGEKLREALEDLKTPYVGVMKTYDKPFSKTQREALTSEDYHWWTWRDGKLVAYSDPVVKSIDWKTFKR